MHKLIASVAAAALFAGAAAPAVAQSRGEPSHADQARAREEMRAGRTMSSREIEGMIVPRMAKEHGRYLSFEYDSAASAYRLKFLRDAQVTWVDVDARTGRVLRISK